MKKIILISLIIVVIFLAGCQQSIPQDNQNNNEDNCPFVERPADNDECSYSPVYDAGGICIRSYECQLKQQDNNEITGQNPKTYNIEITQDGSFVPAELRIKQGDKVTWTNNWDKDSWPASAAHPTHEVYPGSSIQKCNTDEESRIFDACKGIKPGESWSFTFNEKGSWNYHNHLVLGKFGKVIVE